ncbi:MAG: putative sugar O-methyltransferase [Magnetovibrio sp.]|nr:putative sugar O-methyltransferase [Magnetovibrio sp.]
MTVHITKDEELLDEMIKAQTEAGYMPSSHWKSYEDVNIIMMKRVGLDEILSFPNSFGNFPSKVWIPASFIKRAVRFAAKKIRTTLGMKPALLKLPSVAAESIEVQMRYMMVCLCEALYNVPNGNKLFELHDSFAGSTPEIHVIDNNKFSFQFVYYFSRALWMINNLTLPHGAVVVEIGPGYGGFTEVLRKLRPDLRIGVVDIVPQLYLVEQRLSAIFGNKDSQGAVLGFRNISSMDEIKLDQMDEGDIAIIPPWLFARASGISVGINHASMQEMDRSVAKQYIDHLANAGMKAFYLVHYAPGIGSMDNATTSEFLIDCFKENGLKMKHFSGFENPDSFATRSEHHGHDHFIFERDGTL